MDDEDTGAARTPLLLPLRDARQVHVQRAVLWLFAIAGLACTMAALLHWQHPQPRALDRTVPLLLALACAALFWRQWRHPQHLISTLWLGWSTMILGLAVPVWIYLHHALSDGEPLLELLPPISPVLLCSLVVMAVFARSADAWRAALVAWALIAAPVLAYLLTHREQLWTPRGLELLLALGPFSLLMPLLIPLLRVLEQRFHRLHTEGERLQALAERDVLLGLFNRRAAERLVGARLAQPAADTSLLLFDIDHFKQVNDRHGHAAGDAVLIEVSRRCSQLLGRDDMLARWGGEEFLVLLPDLPAAEGAAFAERLRAAIHAQPIAPAGAVSASFGVTAARAGETLAQLLQRADEALYRAKAEGRNRVAVR